MLFRQNTRKTGNNVIEMLQTLHYMAQFKRFTGQGLNLFEYAFNFIQNWERKRMLYNFIRRCLFFLAVMAEGDESSQVRMAN